MSREPFPKYFMEQIDSVAVNSIGRRGFVAFDKKGNEMYRIIDQIESERVLKAVLDFGWKEELKQE